MEVRVELDVLEGKDEVGFDGEIADEMRNY